MRIAGPADYEGRRLTFGQAHRLGLRAAGFFERRGERVGVFLLNSSPFAIVWLGLGLVNTNCNSRHHA